MTVLSIALSLGSPAVSLGEGNCDWWWCNHGRLLACPAVCWHIPKPLIGLVLQFTGFRHVGPVQSAGLVKVVSSDGTSEVPR